MLGKKGIDYSGAVVGDILCSDLSYVTRANYASSGKIGIGVILQNTNRTIKVLAKNQWKERWSPSLSDVPTLTNVNYNNAPNDLDGDGNTAKIIAHFGTSQNYAARSCRSYAPSGVCQGSWYLPASGELYLITASNILTIDSSISAIGGDILRKREFSQTINFSVFYGEGNIAEDITTENYYYLYRSSSENSASKTTKLYRESNDTIYVTSDIGIEDTT
ncbi:MAG: hypothetical protein Q8S24_10780, partial [Eubacteriales bacterium]|nr:hypothetical protein [Eubacteriales bacterium]